MAEVLTVELTEDDIPGAIQDEPLECHTIPSLRWWLLCRGVHAPTSWNKPKLISRIQEAKKLGATKVVDVDGSYLCRKHQKLQSKGLAVVPLGIPDVPLLGWESVTVTNYMDMAKKIPCVTPGLLYTYLAEGVGNTSGRGAFRALQRGFTHWSSGRLDHLEVNTKNRNYCHIRCQMTPSMKAGLYPVTLLLGRNGDLATIESATCQCAAGKSASCTHVSGLLHALVAMCPGGFQLAGNDADVTSEEEALPITSFACQWKVPHSRKESTALMSESTFQKYVYGRERKRSLKPLEDFDPRPEEYRGTAMNRLPELLDKLHGKGLCISLALDSKSRCWSETKGDSTRQLPPQLPTKKELQERVTEFKKSLYISPEKCRDIEEKTRAQHHSPLWYSVRRYRITASNFGQIIRRRPTTPPESLVLQILGTRTFSTAATEWGKKNESLALHQYAAIQHASGHSGLCCSASGFVISEDFPFLGASPDASVYDPLCANPFGLVEVKCPYSCRNVTPSEACSQPNFCCTMETNTDGGVTPKLRRNHPYYSQVQGQMGVTARKWCDFVIFTLKGLSIERISFDREYWQEALVPKLTENCLAPEVLSPVHVLGLPVRDLRIMQ